jgi:hypothetical protein
MAEPVEIDHLPVKLTAAQQKKWDSGDAGKREVRKIIREDRLARQYTDEEVASMPKAPSFKEVMGE